MRVNFKTSLLEESVEELKQSLKREIEQMDHAALPLQQGMSQSSYVSDSPFSVVVLELHRSDEEIRLKAGIFFAGIIFGSCCADDPTPCDELTEYCELEFLINPDDGEAEIRLLE
ncbi:hypothetical protein BOV89_07060 [Solemya velum gill symbiont]|nr:hypothetical protein BOV89_07060 [Solemya velum gill symbiont]OOY45337.1 hypothetical protein BOV92_05640 [Solemya velum gill symbiont]